MSREHAEKGNDTETFLRRKPVPLAMAKGPYEYIPRRPGTAGSAHQFSGHGTLGAKLGPLQIRLACCAIELIASASAPQYDLLRFGSEVFRSSPRQADLMVVAGTVSIKIDPRLRLL